MPTLSRELKYVNSNLNKNRKKVLDEKKDITYIELVQHKLDMMYNNQKSLCLKIEEKSYETDYNSHMVSWTRTKIYEKELDEQVELLNTNITKKIRSIQQKKHRQCVKEQNAEIKKLEQLDSTNNFGGILYNAIKNKKT